MIPLLGLLKNPLFKFVAEKTVGAISHKLEKDKIIKAKEIEAASKLDVAKVGVQLEQVRQQEHSIKDEILTIKISLIFLFVFLPFSQPYMEKGFEILKNAPVEFWYAILIVYSGSFGISTINKFKKKK
jgi:hypothetical protein|tara:strand:+ start:56 stop:439 length:384 start_codon:yes stop_codon:yes gene_type:complete